MTDEEFEAACDAIMGLIDADGCSANLTERTLSIDFHGEQVPALLARLWLGVCSVCGGRGYVVAYEGSRDECGSCWG